MAKSKSNRGAKVLRNALRKTKFRSSVAAAVASSASVRPWSVPSSLRSCIFHGMTSERRSPMIKSISGTRARMTRGNGLIPAKKPLSLHQKEQKPQIKIGSAPPPPYDAAALLGTGTGPWVQLVLNPTLANKLGRVPNLALYTPF